jgi:hypothetical protein
VSGIMLAIRGTKLLKLKTAPIRLTEKLAKFGSFIPIQLVLVLLKQYKKKLKKRTTEKEREAEELRK